MARPKRERRDETGDRGRDASSPRGLGKPGWRDVALRTRNEITADHVSIVAAGVAFFGLLALFPAIASLVAIAGLVMDPADVSAQLSGLANALPENAAEIVRGQAEKVAESDGAAVGFGAALGIVLSLYSASKGMKTLMEGMNIAYDEEEDRGFLKLNLVALGLTLFLILGLLVALAAIVVAPALLGSLGLGDGLRAAVEWGRWPLLALLTVGGLAVIYRFAPSRATPRWRWVSPGALVATLLWVAASLAFSVYVRNFGTYNETYGALGGVIVLLTWLWISAFVVLLGAELNSEAEHQTDRDSTTGRPRRMGRRGAVKADTTGVSP
jgi:membrane protein